MSNKSSGADTDGVVYLRSALWVAGEVRARITDGLRVIDWEHAQQQLRLIRFPALWAYEDINILRLNDEFF